MTQTLKTIYLNRYMSVLGFFLFSLHRENVFLTKGPQHIAILN